LSYRDELAAARSRADALDRELAEARASAHAENERDDARIAELERSLAEAQRQLATPEAKPVAAPPQVSSPMPAATDQGVGLWPLWAIVAGMVALFLLMFLRSCS
jgi:septal ring factor EnvC (AmiA/AmiB activator)